jgi:hypothetical protein
LTRDLLHQDVVAALPATASSSRSSAAALKACMLAMRSLLPVSSVIACSLAPATAMQLWPAASP